MANVRWKDKSDIATLAATDRIPVTDDVAGAATDKYTTPAEIQTYVFSTAFSINGKLTAGANEIEGSAFDINGGTIDGATIGITVPAAGAFTTFKANTLDSNINCQNYNMTNVDIDSGAIDGVTIGTNSAVTELQVDNININGNTISSTAGTDLNITPLAGQQIVLDGTIVIDAGVVTGLTSISCSGTSTLGAIDASGAVLLSSAYFAFDGSVQTLTGAGAIDAGEYLVTRLSLTDTSNALTIADGNYEGQIKIIRVVAEIAGEDTGVLAGANFQGTSLTFTDTGSGAILIWDEALGEWYCIASNHCVYAE